MVTTYTLAALNKLGSECLQWDPVIVRDAFQSAFSVKLHQKGFDKLMTGLSMVGTDMFTASIEGFLSCAAVLNNQVFNANQIPYVDLKQCCWAVWAYKELLGDLQGQQYCSDIIAYIQQLMKTQGISKLPDFMQFAFFNGDQMKPIQEALIGDDTAFQAYNTRQQQQVAQINTYVTQQQSLLVQQLQALQKAGIVAQ